MENLMTFEEELKCKMLSDILANEVQYNFDLGYRNDMTFEERAEGFVNFSKFITSSDIARILQDYGLDYFLDADLYTGEEKDYMKMINRGLKVTFKS